MSVLLPPVAVGPVQAASSDDEPSGGVHWSFWRGGQNYYINPKKKKKKCIYIFIHKNYEVKPNKQQKTKMYNSIFAFK